MRVFVSIIVLAASGVCVASDQSAIHEEILKADQAFFTAFNSCDLDSMGEIFSRDLEFYHDITGYAGYDQTMAVTKNNCERQLGLVRTLVEGSMSVSPLGSFGAVHRGQHTFCHEVQGENDCGTFEFIHIWKRQETGWKLHRVISNDH